jgi:hypothetical protein
MEFGDKRSFGVEFELSENHGGAWLYGKFCYWINGVQVGDYELGTSLRDILFQMKWIVHDCGNRGGGILCNLRPDKAFSLLDGLLYENSERRTNHETQSLDTPARFEITIPVDIFNQWKAYLIECDNNATIVYKNIDEIDAQVATIPIGFFDRVIKEAYDNLNRLYDSMVVD